jgi:hypothetical protein
LHLEIFTMSAPSLVSGDPSLNCSAAFFGMSRGIGPTLYNLGRGARISVLGYFMFEVLSTVPVFLTNGFRSATWMDPWTLQPQLDQGQNRRLRVALYLLTACTLASAAIASCALASREATSHFSAVPTARS